MTVNWKVRLSNPMFWLTVIPALLLLVQLVLNIFGISIDITALEGQLLAIVDVVFVILVAIGIVNDPTTKGLSDSTQAMTYTEPKE